MMDTLVDFSKNLHQYAKMNAESESATIFFWTQWEMCEIDEYNDVTYWQLYQ